MTAPARPLVLLLAGLALLGGCAQPNPLRSRRITLGALKSSVSRLEFEKEQLRREVAELDAERTRLADRLSEAEASNDELATRLDDARHLLENHDALADAPRHPLPGESESSSAPRTTPARQRPERKPPFARIPGLLEPAPPEDSADDEDQDDRIFRRDDTSLRLDPGPPTRLGIRSAWSPVARGGLVDEPGPR